MNAEGEHGLWGRTAPPPPPTLPLAEDLSVDVAVVGGGYTGLSAALHLAQSGARVAVLEAAEIGHGGSGRNVGLVNAGLWVMPDDVPKALGVEHGERLLTLLGGAPAVVFDLIERYGIACEPVRAGTLHLATDAAGLAEIRRRHAQWTARGAPVTLLDAAETATRVGGGRYLGALHDARAGTIQPLAYARGLAAACVAAGVAIFTRSPARSASRDASGASGRHQLSTPEGTVHADWVLVTTNAYTGVAGRSPWPQVAAELVPFPYFNLATKPLSDNLRRSVLPRGEGAWDTRKVLTSFRLDAAGRLIFGSVGATRGAGAAIHAAWARRAIRRIFPQLGDVDFEHAWWGRIGMTADSLPRFHRLAENVLSVSGYNGRGIGPGTVFGQMLARYVGGERDELPVPLTSVGSVSFRGLRAASYEAGAKAAHFIDARL